MKGLYAVSGVVMQNPWPDWPDECCMVAKLKPKHLQQLSTLARGVCYFMEQQMVNIPAPASARCQPAIKQLIT